MVVLHGSLASALSEPSGFRRITVISKFEAATIVKGFAVEMVNDEMVEAWFATHTSSLDNVSEAALAAVAMWFPIVSVAANDRLIGVLIDHVSAA